MSHPAKKAAILGASGYTGADLLRLGLNHPGLEFVALTAERSAGKVPGDIWPHLVPQTSLPTLESVKSLDFTSLDLDVLFCCLPHGTTQEVLVDILTKTGHPLLGGQSQGSVKKAFKVIDLSADFRIRDIETYTQWYGGPHLSEHLQSQAAYGLTELNRGKIKKSSLIACPGCYPTAALISLIPLLETGLIDPDDIRIDAKSGVTGAGRSLREGNLFSEVSDALHPYGLTGHRHIPEIEQEIALAAQQSADQTRVSFIPHLIPMNRGELETISVKLTAAHNVDDLKKAWQSYYKDEAFIHILEGDRAPSTRMVRGSNHCMLNAYEDRRTGFATLVVVLDNLVKGSAGQALQNFNLAFGYPETTGLDQIALFP